MPILNLQRSFSEVGRIRIGEQKSTSSGGKRPAKLETFRLTSADKSRIAAAAKLYGGQVSEWQAPAGKQWEVITEADTIPVLVPPVADMVFTQWYELWSGGGCQRRCDTQTETISDGPCLCEADARECKPHSRLSILLPELPGLGVWRLDTQGFYAARELGYSVDNIIALYARRGDLLPATLRLDQRMVKRAGQGTKRFVVPVLDVAQSPDELLRSRSVPGADLAAIEAQQRAPLTPVPEDVEPTPSIAEQTAALEAAPPPKKRGGKPVDQTGIQPRTVEQRRAAQRSAPSEPPPDPSEPVDVEVEEAPPANDPAARRLEALAAQQFNRVEDRREKTGMNVIEDDPDMGKAHQAPPPAEDTRERPAQTETEVSQPGMFDSDPQSDNTSVTLITKQQLTKLSTLMRDAGMTEPTDNRFLDPPSRRQLVASIIGRDVTANELTEEEATKVISTFETDQHIAARHKLDMLLRGAGFDEPEAQDGFVTSAVNHDTTLPQLTGDEIATVTAILESDNERSQ